MLVEGHYLVEVRLNGYSNPTGKCHDERNCRIMSDPPSETYCCDGCGTIQCSGGESSDSYFIYCLRPFGDVRQPPEGCSKPSNEHRSISSVNTDDRPLNFSHSTVLGLNNPQILSGLEGPYEVSDQSASIVYYMLAC